MNFEDLQKVWQQEPAQRPEENAKVIVAVVRRKARAFDRSIMWRDVREVVAAVFVAVAFGWIGLDAKSEGASPWLCWLAAVIPLGVASYMLVDRRRTRRLRSKGGESVLEEIDLSLAMVRHQAWLLRNVLWWYILPLAASALLIVLFVLLETPLPVSARVVLGAVMLLIIAATNTWVWRLNRNAVRRHLEPQINELENHREMLAAPARDRIGES